MRTALSMLTSFICVASGVFSWVAFSLVDKQADAPGNLAHASSYSEIMFFIGCACATVSVVSLWTFIELVRNSK